MTKESIIFAKLAGLHKTLMALADSGISRADARYFNHYERLRRELINVLPQLYEELEPVETPDIHPDGNYDLEYLYQPLTIQLEYIFEVRSNCQIGQVVDELPRRVFISHGRSPDWHKTQAYIEKDVKIETLELAQEANRGRTVLQKLNEEANRCSYAVIVMTGDDVVGEGENPRTRENVMHEIGFFQGKYGLANVCLLYEEGTNIPSNIHGLIYIPFPKSYIEATFGALRRELEAAFSEHKS